MGAEKAPWTVTVPPTRGLTMTLMELINESTVQNVVSRNPAYLLRTITLTVYQVLITSDFMHHINELPYRIGWWPFDESFINKMNKTDIAYLRCIRSFLSFKTNALWFIVFFIIIFLYENSNNKDKLAYIKQINETLTKIALLDHSVSHHSCHVTNTPVLFLSPPCSKYVPVAMHRMPWGWVNIWLIFLFGWTIPLSNKSKFHFFMSIHCL